LTEREQELAALFVDDLQHTQIARRSNGRRSKPGYALVASVA
jgi:hypothetical protein